MGKVVRVLNNSEIVTDQQVKECIAVAQGIASAIWLAMDGKETDRDRLDCLHSAVFGLEEVLGNLESMVNGKKHLEYYGEDGIDLAGLKMEVGQSLMQVVHDAFDNLGGGGIARGTGKKMALVSKYAAKITTEAQECLMLRYAEQYETTDQVNAA